MEQKYRDYLDFIEDAQAYNNLLFVERKLRLPFIDPQTGVAQNDCSLWRSQSERSCASNSNGRAGTLYSYPALKWQKRRREYLMKRDLTTATSEQQANRLPCTSGGGNGGETSTSSSRLSHINHKTYSAQQNNSSNSHNSASSTPTRTDSGSGSHSTCGSSNLQDSDSKDPSQFATSQPFRDNPSRNHVNEINCDLTDNYSSGSIVERNRFSDQHEFSSLTKRSHREQQQQFEAQTKAAIRLHSKMSKKRKKGDAGQSLMRNSASNSLLIKNGRHKTGFYSTIDDDDDDNHDEHMFGHSDKLNKITENERQEFKREIHNNNVIHHDPKDEDINESSHHKSSNGVDCLKSKAIITNGSRPYACAICDQTYKTRPGLSYHFLHTHNTTLPKNLPNMRNVTRKHEHPNIDSSFSSSISNNSNSSAGSGSKANSNEKRREPESISVKGGSRLLRSGRVTRSQERSRANDNDDDDEKTEEEDYGDIDQANKEPEQSIAIRKENTDDSNTDHHANYSMYPEDREADDNSDKLAHVACNNNFAEDNINHSLTHSMRISDTKVVAADDKMAIMDDKEHQQSDDILFEIYRKQNNMVPPKRAFDSEYINSNARLAIKNKNETRFDSGNAPVLQQKIPFCDLLSPEALVD